MRRPVEASRVLQPDVGDRRRPRGRTSRATSRLSGTSGIRAY